MRKLGIGTAVALVGVVALVAGGVALATNGDEKGETRAGEAFGPPPLPPPPVFLHERRGERRDEFAKDLAAELDVEPEEVEEALRNVFKSHLDKAVEDEWLTQKQADRMLDCYDGKDSCRAPEIRHSLRFRDGDGLRFRRGHRGPPRIIPFGPPPGMPPPGM